MTKEPIDAPTVADHLPGATIMLTAIALYTFLSWCAQDPAPPSLPTVLRLGPLPAELPQRTLPWQGDLPQGPKASRRWC